MEITHQSKLLEVLQAYPFLEDKIVSIAPVFRNLKNPILRRTVGQLATIEKVAQIGNIDPAELVNTLRLEAGKPELKATAATGSQKMPVREASDPDWILGEPQFIVNGNELLSQGIVPVQHVTGLLEQLKPGSYLVLMTDFEPSPIMDAMHKQNRQVFHKIDPQEPSKHITYIQ